MISHLNHPNITKVARQKLCQRLVIGDNGGYLCLKKYPLTSIIHNLDISQLQQFPCSLYTKILFRVGPCAGT